MKTAGFLLILGIGCLLKDPGTGRLNAFLEKLDRLYAKGNRGGTDSSMPNFYERESIGTMLMPDIRFFDAETGLEYFPRKREIYYPDLEMRLDVTTKTVYDVKTGKEYRLDELQRKRRSKKT